MVSRAIDVALDRTVAVGYGSVGLALRRRLRGWPADPPRMDGKVAIVTGARAGIGKAAAEGLRALGADVRGLTRDDLDVSSMASVNAFCERFAAEEERLDVLVHNAGVLPAERGLSDDGHELQFATHVLGPFALVDRLTDLMAASAPARVITVSSGGMYARKLDLDALTATTGEYDKTRVYANAKRAQVILSELWARELHDRGIVSHAMHPGWVDTGGVQDALPGFRAVARPILRDAEQGADTIVWLAGAPEAAGETGLFWQDRRPRPTHYLPVTRESDSDRQALWELCRALTARPGQPPA